MTLSADTEEVGKRVWASIGGPARRPLPDYALKEGGDNEIGPGEEPEEELRAPGEGELTENLGVPLVVVAVRSRARPAEARRGIYDYFDCSTFLIITQAGLKPK